MDKNIWKLRLKAQKAAYELSECLYKKTGNDFYREDMYYQIECGKIISQILKVGAPSLKRPPEPLSSR